MHDSRDPIARRNFIRATAAGLASFAGVSARSANAVAADVDLSAKHREAVNRRRRIVVQYDAQTTYGIDIDTWLDFRFGYIDQPGSQIDSVFWDLGRLGQVLYPSRFLDPMVNAKFQKWRDRGTDIVGRLIAETKRRGLEAFWHHRASEVDLNATGTGAAWKDAAAPLKQAHPDWVLKTGWWRHGLWNFAVSAVREHTVRTLREVAGMYDIDGVQIDFSRHVPCLPVGRQWELRDHVTELMRMTRQMALEVQRNRGRPLLVAAKVPRNLEGCRIDGFDIEVWAKESLVDILTLGSRSADVDIGAFRRVTADRNIKLQPCFDDHHTTDGYRYPPIDVLRGVFSNWLQQGADGIVTFNWSNAPPEVCEQLGQHPGPLSHQQAYREAGSIGTMSLKDKTFFVERRGGYPWAEGFFNQNNTAPLPMNIDHAGEKTTLKVRISDDLKRHADKVKRVLLRLVLFGAGDDETLKISFNGTSLPLIDRNPEWKDPQIFSPKPQPASGGSGIYRVDPSQRLLRLDFEVDPRQCRIGENVVSIGRSDSTKKGAAGKIALEKLEIHVRYG